MANKFLNGIEVFGKTKTDELIATGSIKINSDDVALKKDFDSYDTSAEVNAKLSSYLLKDSTGLQTVSSDLALTGYVLIDNLAIETLKIKGLTASSDVTFNAGLTVGTTLNANNVVATNSIKVGTEDVALKSDLTDFITLEDLTIDNLPTDVVITSELNNILKNYDTAATAAGKFKPIAWGNDSTNKATSFYADSIVATNSIKIGADNVALAKDIPDVSSYITKNVNDLTNYTTTENLNTLLDDKADINSVYTKSEIDTKNSAFLLKESTGLQTVSSDLALTGYVLIDNLSIDTLKIKGLTASSDVTFGAGLTVGTTLNANNIVASNSIKVGNTEVALKTDIPTVPDVSSYITKDVNDLTNYTTTENLNTLLDDKADKATTIAGYGITDAYTQSEVNTKLADYLVKDSTGLQTISSDLALTGYVLIDNLSIDTLKIKGLTASSDVTFNAGLTVGTTLNANNIVASNSIKIGNDNVALAKNIPDVSSYITKDVDNLTNYTTTNDLGRTYAKLTDITAVLKFQGSISTVDNLPTGLNTTTDIGKVYNIETAGTINNQEVKAGDNVVWTANGWDVLAGTIDLSNFVEKTELNSYAKLTDIENFVTTDSVYTKSEIDAKNSSFLVKDSTGLQTISSDLALTGYVLIDNLSIDTLKIKGLTASSDVTFNAGLTVGTTLNANNVVATNSIKIGADNVALAKDIPDVSSYITKNVNDLTNYTTTENLNTLLDDKANKATTLAGYGITDAYTQSEVNSKLEELNTSLENSKANKATTLAGYGITDAYTQSEVDGKLADYLVKDSTGLQTISSDLALTGYVLIDNLAIDTLNIKGLTASSDVTFNAGLTVGTTINANNIVATNSIKVGDTEVALKTDIPTVEEINIFEETIGAITSTNGLITWNIIPSTQFILKPLIQVYDSEGNQIYCNVKYVKSTNTVTIEIVSSNNTVGGEYTATIFGK